MAADTATQLEGNQKFLWKKLFINLKICKKNNTINQMKLYIATIPYDDRIIASCKQPQEARRPISQTSGSFMKNQ
jgi:hypothetical protein